ncbi:MAG TPA: 2-phospho-L-lactate guanylyltransferase [Marmoricola sp.]|nr:2-phospho-L-lactate guanylyltransferase [Marmoricola sp.]
MKDSSRAKSRLGGARADRRRLAIAMARDTLDAITGAPNVDGVLVVRDGVDDEAAFETARVGSLVCPGYGLNESIRAGEEALREADPRRNVAVLPGDLPYLSSGELEALLDAAARHRSAFVADRWGTGTTLLTAIAGVRLAPAFGGESRRAHRALGSVELELSTEAGLRRDVDVRTDLDNVPALGRWTQSALQDTRAGEPSLLSGTGAVGR